MSHLGMTVADSLATRALHRADRQAERQRDALTRVNSDPARARVAFFP